MIVSSNINRIGNTIILFICLFFVMSAVTSTYFPSINSLAQGLILFFSLIYYFYLLKYSNQIILFISFIAFSNLLISPIFALNGYAQSYVFLTYILNIFLGYILFSNYKFSTDVLYIFLFANSIAIILEIFYQVNFVNISEGYESPSIRFLYKFGLFSAPKSGAFFIIIVSLLAFINKNIWILFCGTVISIFTGVRVSTVCLSIPLIYLFFIDSSYKKSVKFIILILIILIVTTIGYAFYNEYGKVIERLINALNTEDGSNMMRFNFWKQHWHYFLNQPIEHIIWGNYRAADIFVGNGPECAFLDLLNNGGLVSLFLFLFPLVLLLRYINMFNYIFCFSIFIAMISGRFSIGFSDGIVYWFVIFYLLNKTNQSFPEKKK